MGNPEAPSSSSGEVIESILKTTDFFGSGYLKTKQFIACSDNAKKNDLSRYCFMNRDHLEKFYVFETRCQENEGVVLQIAILVFLKERGRQDVQDATNGFVKSAIKIHELCQYCEEQFGEPKAVKPTAERKTKKPTADLKSEMLTADLKFEMLTDQLKNEMPAEEKPADVSKPIENV